MPENTCAINSNLHVKGSYKIPVPDIATTTSKCLPGCSVLIFLENLMKQRFIAITQIKCATLGIAVHQ
jgi:hypothetical protein